MAGTDLATDVARTLRDSEISAHPCPWLGAVSILVDDFYENFDYDLIGPKARLAIARALENGGFRQRSGRVFDGESGHVEFPRPTRTLSSDPSGEFETLLERPNTVALATPTQIVLTTWRRHGPTLSPDLLAELRQLVFHQPANFSKIWGWLRRTESAESFKNAHPALAAAQADGIEARTRRARKGTAVRAVTGNNFVNFVSPGTDAAVEETAPGMRAHPGSRIDASTPRSLALDERNFLFLCDRRGRSCWVSVFSRVDDGVESTRRSAG